MNVSFSNPWMFQNTRQGKAKNLKTGNLPSDRDTVTISLFGQNNNSRIQHLMSQKQYLLEQKNQWIQSALENGQDVNSIQDRLDSYEEQMKQLDQQIFQEMKKQNNGQFEKTPPSRKADEPKTRQEMEQEKISNLVDLSWGISRARAIQASQTQVEGEARVLESEIKTDKGKTEDTEITARQEEKLAQLQQKAAELTSKAAEISGEVVEKIHEDNTP